MKSILTSAIALGLAASTAFAQQLTINTPSNVVECQPLLITWSGGTPPYFLSILPGSQPGASALVTFNQTNANQVTWLVNQAAGTSLGCSLRDSTGTVAQSAPFTVLTGTSTSCIGGNATTSISFGTTGASAPTSAGTSGSSPATTTSPSTGSGSSASSPARTSAGSTSTSAASTKSAAASRVNGQIAVAGIIGAALVALLG